MGQSPSTANSSTTINRLLPLPPPPPIISAEKITCDVDYTDNIPDECLAYIFQFLSASDRKHCSYVCRRWYLVDGCSRHRLSLKAQTEIITYIPLLFTRFDSVTKLALRCDRKSISLNDDAFVMISIRCQNLERLKLRGCREITDNGMAAFAKNCKKLKKLSCGSCAFGVKGINEMLNHCTAVEELSIKRLRGVHDENIGAGKTVSSLSLKKICLKELVSGQAFEQLVIGCKKLKTLKIIRCLGDWDKVFDMIGKRNECLTEVHLERIQVSDIGLEAISKWVNMEILHIAKTPECSNLGLVSIAENCRKLRKLHIDGWRSNRIGDEGLIAVAKQCINLQELVLIGVNATHLSLAVIAANCRKLERLALCGSSTISDHEIACIAAKCLSLKKLCIKGCAISDIAIEALAWGCPNLVKIKVKKCRGVSSEVVDWLQERNASLVVNFDAVDSEGVNATSLSDGGNQDSGSEFPAISGQMVLADGPSSTSSSSSSGRLALFRAKLGVFATRNHLVTCAFSWWSSNEDSGSNNNL
ncbi:F-box protein SKIP2 [Ricinus communis]|uniref:Skip-2, putative n=1 Tax=Ricinus communis TaxID=3988 RepID=B9SFZ9_RICCO|nr:F-box protein SKIP2 [Ricinus communis]EEF37415.1 skip-2, putative [Ricinus communis]|eukprot:XP_002524918.1 F-box protein SKIP2 [Ricinus communis]